MNRLSKEKALKRLREKRLSRKSRQGQGYDRIINLILLVFTLAAVLLAIAVFFYFDI